jgi:hypothetical protein
VGVDPPWNPRDPVKYWSDPNALKSTKRTVVYQTCVTGRIVDGQPEIDVAAFSKERAATVNIPPEGWSDPVIPAEPLPIRELHPNEELFVGFGGLIQVRDKSMAPVDVGAMLTKVYDLLQRVASKLEVT